MTLLEAAMRWMYNHSKLSTEYGGKINVNLLSIILPVILKLIVENTDTAKVDMDPGFTQ